MVVVTGTGEPLLTLRTGASLHRAGVWVEPWNRSVGRERAVRADDYRHPPVPPDLNADVERWRAV